MTDSIKTSATHPLQVDFLPREELGLPGRVGLTSAPGRKDYEASDGPWHRDLEADLTRLRSRYRVDQLLTLLERGEFVRDELREMRIQDLVYRAKRMGMQAEWCSMPGGGVPVPGEQLYAVVEGVLAVAAAGQTVVIHSRTGLGRAGLVAACCLCAMGASVDEALGTVRALRPGALETPAKLQSLSAFDRLWRTRMMERSEGEDISDVFPLSTLTPTPGIPAVAEPLAPLSHAGAATLSYVGPERAGTPPTRLMAGDLLHLLPGRVLSFGSSATCDVHLPDRRIEPVHTLVTFAAVGEGNLLVTDFGTKNGTRVCEQVTTAAFLPLGADLLLADTYRFRFLSIG